MVVQEVLFHPHRPLAWALTKQSHDTNYPHERYFSPPPTLEQRTLAGRDLRAKFSAKQASHYGL